MLFSEHSAMYISHCWNLLKIFETNNVIQFITTNLSKDYYIQVVMHTSGLMNIKALTPSVLWE